MTGEDLALVLGTLRDALRQHDLYGDVDGSSIRRSISAVEGWARSERNRLANAVTVVRGSWRRGGRAFEVGGIDASELRRLRRAVDRAERSLSAFDAALPARDL